MAEEWTGTRKTPPCTCPLTSSFEPMGRTLTVRRVEQFPVHGHLVGVPKFVRRGVVDTHEEPTQRLVVIGWCLQLVGQRYDTWKSLGTSSATCSGGPMCLRCPLRSQLDRREKCQCRSAAEAGREHFEISAVLSTLITVPWCSFGCLQPRPPRTGPACRTKVAFAIHLEIKAKSWNEGVVFTRLEFVEVGFTVIVEVD